MFEEAVVLPLLICVSSRNAWWMTRIQLCVSIERSLTLYMGFARQGIGLRG